MCTPVDCGSMFRMQLKTSPMQKARINMRWLQLLMHCRMQARNKPMLLTSTPALIGRLLLNRPTLLLQNRWHHKTNSEPADSFINASRSISRYAHRALTFQVCFLSTRHQWVWLSLEQKHYLCSNRLTWHISFNSSRIFYLLQSPLWSTIPAK